MGLRNEVRKRRKIRRIIDENNDRLMTPVPFVDTLTVSKIKTKQSSLGFIHMPQIHTDIIKYSILPHYSFSQGQ